MILIDYLHGYEIQIRAHIDDIIKWHIINNLEVVIVIVLERGTLSEGCVKVVDLN